MATKAEVQAAIRELRQFHRTGKEILNMYGLRAIPGEHSMKDMREHFSLPAHVIRAVRKFADPEHGYNKAELTELCELCGQHNRVVGLTLVRHLLTIPDKATRTQFQYDMIREGWTHSRTETELIRRYGRRRQGGRIPKVAEDLDAALLQVEDLTISWRRFVQAFSERDASGGFQKTDAAPEEPRGKTKRSRVPRRLMEEIETVSGAIDHLNTSVSRLIDQLRRKREKR